MRSNTSGFLHTPAPPFPVLHFQLWWSIRTFREISLFRVPRLAMDIQQRSSCTWRHSPISTCLHAKHLTINAVYTARDDFVGLQTVTAVVRSSGPALTARTISTHTTSSGTTGLAIRTRPSIEHSNISIHLKIGTVVERRLLKPAGFFGYPPYPPTFPHNRRALSAVPRRRFPSIRLSAFPFILSNTNITLSSH